jgi:hypothetical protein
MAAGMLRLRDTLKEKQGTKRPFQLSLVFRPASPISPVCLGHGVQAMVPVAWLSRS